MAQQQSENQFETLPALIGAGVVACGVGFVELLLSVGWAPLGPLGFPGLCLILAAAFWGVSGAIGGALALFAYFLFTLGAPQRFPHFFANPAVFVFWFAGLGALAAVAALLRGRLMQAHAQALEATRQQNELSALVEYRKWLNAIIDNAPALIAYVDAEQRFVFHNLELEHWLEKPKNEIGGRLAREVLGEDAYLRLRPHFERALAGARATFHMEHRVRGETRHAQTSCVPDFDPHGRVRGCFMVAKDVGPLIHEQLAAQRGLHEKLQAYERALDATSVAVWDFELRPGGVDELLLQVHPDDREAARRGMHEALEGAAGGFALEQRMRSRGGEWRWTLSRGYVVQRDAAGRALRLAGTHVDIHERKLLEQAIEQRGREEAAAGVASQSLLAERLRRAMARSQRSGVPLALMHLDIDRFRPLADALGGPAAEALLAEVGRRLRGCVRVTDTVARIGADQFVVLLDALKERSDAFRVAEKMLQALREPIAAGGREANITASIGVAFPQGGDAAPEELVKRAGSALAAAKNAGRDAYRSAE